MKTEGLSDTQINEAIAKVCGWHKEKLPFQRHATLIETTLPGTVCDQAWWHEDVAGCSSGPPDYVESLDAMHVAVVAQSDVFIEEFETALLCEAVVQGVSFVQLIARDWAKCFLAIFTRLADISRDE